MRSTQCLLTDRHLQAHAAAFFQAELPLKPSKRVCTPSVMWGIILYAASWQLSLAHVCGVLRDAPCSDTLHDALLPQIGDHTKLSRQINRLLSASVRSMTKSKKRRSYPIAIDLNLIPYYGRPGSTAWIYTSKQRQGTRRFHAYATAYVVWKGQRYTAAMTCVHDKEAMAVVVKRLMQQVSKTGLRVRYLLLDRGFYAVAVFRYLQAARVPFLLPAIVRGRKATTERPAGGTRRFAQCKKSGWYTYQLTNHKEDQKATVSICVQCRNHAGHKGKHGRYVWLFAYWGLQPSSHRWIRETYRQRFGIETSYRQMHEGRGRTSSRSAELRLLFVGVALVLRNLWVWWHWEVLAQRQRGGRRLRAELLPLCALLERIASVCKDIFGGLKPLYTRQPLLN